MKTGEDVRDLGLYATECCMQEALFDSGECFSRCPQCSNLCDWEIVDIESSSRDIRVLRERASIGKVWTRRPAFSTGTFRYSL
jgi:hypothetical protein